MLKQAAAGVAGLGLIGGAGSVIYGDGGDATVEIRNEKTGQVESVQLSGGGQSFSCPSGTSDKLEPRDIRIGRIKLTIQRVRTELREIEDQYPSGVAPDPVVNRYNSLADRDDRLVEAYNAQVDARNAIIDRECSPAD